MPLPTNRELREMLEEATPGPWEFDFANLRWDERPASTLFWVSGDGPLDIAQRDAQSENRDQTEQNFTLIALAPQLAEEVIRLREEIDRLKWYCLDGCRVAEAEEAHTTGEHKAREQGKQEAYYGTYLQITQEQHKENK